jgi:MFS family permease
MGEVMFLSWGWRLPFLLSVFLIIVSVYIRNSLHESPLFIKLKKEHEELKTPSKRNPLVESFCNPKNLYYVCLALFGGVLGQALVSNTSHFFTFVFIETYCKVPTTDTYIIVGIACLLGSVIIT